MAISTSATSPLEESVLVITLAWTDEDGSPVTPSAATWTLTDLAGNIINSRSAVAIAGLSTSNTVVLSGNDLAIDNNGIHRQFLVQFTYDSSAGSDLPGKDALNFDITDVVAVT